MAFTYSDWDTQETRAERVSRGLLFVQELTDAITAEVNADGRSVSTSSLMQLRTEVRREVDQERARLERESGTTVGTGHAVNFGEC